MQRFTSGTPLAAVRRSLTRTATPARCPVPSSWPVGSTSSSTAVAAACWLPEGWGVSLLLLPPSRAAVVVSNQALAQPSLPHLAHLPLVHVFLAWRKCLEHSRAKMNGRPAPVLPAACCLLLAQLRHRFAAALVNPGSLPFGQHRSSNDGQPQQGRRGLEAHSLWLGGCGLRRFCREARTLSRDLHSSQEPAPLVQR